MTVGKGMAHVWDPYVQKDIQNIEMAQCCATHWVKADYRYNSSVTFP